MDNPWSVRSVRSVSELAMAELKAECPAAPLILAVAPVRMIVPSPLLTIWRDTSRLNKKADRVAISHTFNTPVPWSVTLY